MLPKDVVQRMASAVDASLPPFIDEQIARAVAAQTTTLGSAVLHLNVIALTNADDEKSVPYKWLRLRLLQDEWRSFRNRHSSTRCR